MIIGVALLGFGNVNRELVSLIKEYNGLHTGKTIKVVAVADKQYGSVYNPDGVSLPDLLHAANLPEGFSSLPSGSSNFHTNDIFTAKEIDVICEAIFTNPVDGEPALSYAKKALGNGKHLVTTNKGPIAFALSELQSLADKNGVCLAYEGTVMSGTPVIDIIKTSLPVTEVHSFEGILNGTANFVIAEVENGLSMEAAITKAQDLGYAEANPSADIDGYDVLLKVAILCQTIFSKAISLEDIKREGISGLSEKKIRDALLLNCHWKLIGRARLQVDGSIKASVGPELLGRDHCLGSIHGPTNALTICENMLQQFTMIGPGAGRRPTAYALLADIERIFGTSILAGQAR